MRILVTYTCVDGITHHTRDQEQGGTQHPEGPVVSYQVLLTVNLRSQVRRACSAFRIICTPVFFKKLQSTASVVLVLQSSVFSRRNLCSSGSEHDNMTTRACLLQGGRKGKYSTVYWRCKLYCWTGTLSYCS